jgi:hypothetical protein
MRTQITKKTIRQLLSGTLFVFASVTATQAQSDGDTSTFKPSGNLWGYIFGDYAMKVNNDTLGRGAGNVQYKGTTSLNSNNTTANTLVPANVQSNAFQLRRVYLGYDYNFARNLTGSVVLANEQTLLPNNQNTTYLKYAFLKWSNIWKNSDLIIGQYQTASFATPNGTEPLWGYRSVERTIMDLHNNDGSTDLGLSLLGKIWSAPSTTDSDKPSFLGYVLQVGNGNSATPETDPFKKVRANLYFVTLNQKLTIGAYGDYTTTQLSPYNTSNSTVKAYASYKSEAFRLGFEFFQQTNMNSDVYTIYDPATKLAGTTVNIHSGVQLGFSVFGSAKLIKDKLNIFARYDMFNPDTKWNTNNIYTKAYSGITGSNLAAATFYTQQFVTAGLDWTPNKRFHIMPNVWYNRYSSMMSTSSVDGTGKPYGTRVINDYDLVYRVSFYFIFNGSKKVSNNGMY